MPATYTEKNGFHLLLGYNISTRKLSPEWKAARLFSAG